MNMFNDLVKDDDKKMVEPFNIVGRRSLIFSKEEAAKILKDNSYWIFAAAAVLFATSSVIWLMDIDIGISQEYIIGVGVFYCVLGVCIRELKSRVASLLALASFGHVLITRILQNDTGGVFFFTFIFFAASYRSVKASFFYHKTTFAEEKNIQ